MPVFVHFLNNGAQVLGAYFVKGTPELVDLEQQVQVPWVLAFASLIGTLSLLWYGGRRLNGLHLGS